MDSVVAAVDFTGITSNVNTWLVAAVGIGLAFFGLAIIGKVFGRAKKTG